MIHVLKDNPMILKGTKQNGLDYYAQVAFDPNYGFSIITAENLEALSRD